MNNILIIEDESLTRMMYRNFIHQIVPQYNIYEASNALQGICLCFDKRPQLILLDMMMPMYNGKLIIDILEEGIQKKIISFKPKIIVISAIETIEELTELTRRLTVSAVMPKPLPFETLAEILKFHLRIDINEEVIL
jgi:response regulator of citrate/malate metabolism